MDVFWEVVRRLLKNIQSAQRNVEFSKAGLCSNKKKIIAIMWKLSYNKTVLAKFWFILF